MFFRLYEQISTIPVFGLTLVPVLKQSYWPDALTRAGHALDSCREHLVKVCRPPDSMTKQTG
jgi:hypothetical protein